MKVVLGYENYQRKYLIVVVVEMAIKIFQTGEIKGGGGGMKSPELRPGGGSNVGDEGGGGKLLLMLLLLLDFE